MAPMGPRWRKEQRDIGSLLGEGEGGSREAIKAETSSAPFRQSLPKSQCGFSLGASSLPVPSRKSPWFLPRDGKSELWASVMAMAVFWRGKAKTSGGFLPKQ